MMDPRDLEDLKHINAAADKLNAEAADVLEYQESEDDCHRDRIPQVRRAE